MYGRSATEGLDRSEFEAARLGFMQTLRRKRMSPQFVERNAEDLFAQACFEYSRQVAEGKEIHDPAAWIVTCGWHRTVGLLESRDHRPRMVSTESVGEPTAGEESSPEGAFLGEDRRRKVREAVGRLPADQRRILALSYFDGESVRAAAKRLGWTASKAQRAHEAAQKRIFEILGVESTDDIALEVGLFAFVSVADGRAAGHSLPAGFEAVLDPAHRGLSGLGERATELFHRSVGWTHGHAVQVVGPPVPDGGAGAAGRGPLRRIGDVGRRLAGGGGAEAGAAAAAAEGGGRALEVCKAAIAVCVIGGGAVTGAVLGGGHHRARPQVSRAQKTSHGRGRGAKQPHRTTARAAPVVPVEPAPRREAAREAPRRRERTPPAPRRQEDVEVSGRVATEPKVRRHEVEEAASEESFGAISEAYREEEQIRSEPAGAAASDATESAPSQGAVEAASKPGPRRRAEEHEAAEEFHGLLE